MPIYNGDPRDFEGVTIRVLQPTPVPLQSADDETPSHLYAEWNAPNPDLFLAWEAANRAGVFTSPPRGTGTFIDIDWTEKLRSIRESYPTAWDRLREDEGDGT